MNLNKKAFTLIEIMLWIVIVSIVIVWWFNSYTRVWLWKINLMEKSNMQKDSFYFSEKLFQIIKEWGIIDYEEYFNDMTSESISECMVLTHASSSWNWLWWSWRQCCSHKRTITSVNWRNSLNSSTLSFWFIHEL